MIDEAILDEHADTVLVARLRARVLLLVPVLQVLLSGFLEMKHRFRPHLVTSGAHKLHLLLRPGSKRQVLDSVAELATIA